MHKPLNPYLELPLSHGFSAQKSAVSVPRNGILEELLMPAQSTEALQSFLASKFPISANI